MKTSLLLLFLYLPASLALCYYGTTSSNPAKNCYDIIKRNPSCYGVSGYYWIDCGNGTIQVYCEMEYLQGGWIRIASENFTAGANCSCEWLDITVEGTKYCTVANNDLQAQWHIDNICPYSEVRGYVLVDARGVPDGYYLQQTNIDQNYVDGVAFLYGVNRSTSRTHHLFTYAVASPVGQEPYRSCECQNSKADDPPIIFVGWDQMCDTGYYSSPYDNTKVGPRTLFTGEGCETGDDAYGCCHVAGAPWFYKSIPNTVNEVITVKILCNGNHASEMILVRELELYVR